jgi:hypothetical protein
MTEAGETLIETNMLVRLPDGTPVNVEYGGSEEWKMDQSTSSRVQTKKPENFTPRLASKPVPGSVIEIAKGPISKHFKLAEPMPGQNKPNSVYVEPINSGEFNKLVEKGSPVVRPDNEPSDLPTAA